MDKSEEDLILAMCDQDPAIAKRAFHDILATRGPKIRLAIDGYLKRHRVRANLQDMVDVVFQDFVVQLMRQARQGSLMDASSLGAYMYGIARNCARQYLKKGAGRPQVFSDVLDVWQETDRALVEEGLRPIELQELERAIDQCIAELTGLQRDYITILAEHWDDESPPTAKDIARMVGVSSESVRNRLHEARNNLEECLRRKGQDLPLRRKGVRR